MMIQKNFLLALIPILVIVCSASAQQSVVTSGGDISGAAGTIAYSIGQFVYIPIEGEAGLIYPGVQQPNTSNTVSTLDISDGVCAEVYPNPFAHEFFIRVADDLPDAELDQLSLRLFDLDGRMVWQSKVSQRITPVPGEGLVEGMYILQLILQHYETVSVKLIKTN